MPTSTKTLHDRRWVALSVAAVGALLLLHRRRRARKQATARREREAAAQRQTLQTNGARHAPYPGSDLPHDSSNTSSSTARWGLPPRDKSSGSLSDTYPTVVDIGAVLGVDIGGTLSKLVYFEKKAPSEAESQRKPSEDPMGKKLEMKRTVSLGNLHDTMEQQEALREFYTFMDRASTVGESGVKDSHLSVYSHALGGVLHFFHFETRFMDNAVEVIGNSPIHKNIQALGCTGGGAFKFEEAQESYSSVLHEFHV